ncbi:unnamed protein product [Cochlearia groenlandica]
MNMYEEERSNIKNQEVLRLEMAFPQHGFMFQQLHEDNSHNLPSPTSLPSCPPHLFYGGENYMMNRPMTFTGVSSDHHTTQKSPTMTNMNDDHVGLEEDNLSDDGSHMMLGEKKKRLNLEQVRALEKSFELGNKLEPERKMQLAKSLGLQPRQIAIWFQNRRARWKTKQLERDYDTLKKQFDAVKSDNDSLLAHNKKLHAELVELKKQDHKETSKIKREASWSNNESTENDYNNNNNNNNNNSDINHVNMIKDLFPSSTTTSSVHVDHHMLQEQGFCNNIFNGIDETTSSSYWAWSDQQQQQHNHHQFN